MANPARDPFDLAAHSAAPRVAAHPPTAHVTRVVHCKESSYDVYIGRGRGSIWGNRFEIGVHGTRPEVIAKHRADLLNQPELLARIHELHGQTLGCWCKTKRNPGTACHGDTLAEFAAAAHAMLGTPGAFAHWCGAQRAALGLAPLEIAS